MNSHWCHLRVSTLYREKNIQTERHTDSLRTLQHCSKLNRFEREKYSGVHSRPLQQDIKKNCLWQSPFGTESVPQTQTEWLSKKKRRRRKKKGRTAYIIWACPEGEEQHCQAGVQETFLQRDWQRQRHTLIPPYSISSAGWCIYCSAQQDGALQVFFFSLAMPLHCC